MALGGVHHRLKCAPRPALALLTLCALALAAPARAWPRPTISVGRARARLGGLRATTLEGPAGAPEAAQHATSVPQSTINLVKNIAGTGVLTLPSGIARLADGGSSSEGALGLAAALLVVFGVANAVGFYLIGEVCERTGAKSYSEAWERTVGPGTAWAPTAASFLLCLTSSVACATVIGDTGADLLAAATGTTFDAVMRDEVLLAVAMTVILPLCLLPSLAPLAGASALGVAGTFVTAGAMLARLWDGSYGPGGAFIDQVKWMPTFVGEGGGIASPAAPLAAAVGAASSLADGGGLPSFPAPSAASVALFVSLISNAYLAHYNAPSFLAEMRPEGGSRLAPFTRTVAGGFTLSGVLFLAVAASGYATFGQASVPYILNNYCTGDPLALLARLGVGLSVLFELPLIERPFRRTAAELCGSSAAADAPAAACASVAVITAIAVSGVPLDFIAAISGSTGGAFLIFTAPALMRLGLARQGADSDPPAGEEAPRWAPGMLALWSAARPLEAWGKRGVFDSRDGDAVPSTDTFEGLGPEASRRMGLRAFGAVGLAVGLLGTMEAVVQL